MGKLNKKILVVEDEEAMRKAITAKLVREGFDVLGASDGEAGLQVAAEEHPDLVLLDLVLPKMTGMEVMQKLRDGEKTADIPIIILTNLSAGESITRGVVKNEPSYYLVKTDWTLDDVVQKVKEVLHIS